MAKISKSQAEQITNAYKEIRDISAQYPTVNASESVNDTIYATIEYFRTINVYVNMDGLVTRINDITRCTISDETLIIEGSGGYARFDISDE